MGLWNVGDDLRCRHTNRDNETCDRPIERGPQHALDGKSSPSKIKLQNSMCRALQLRRQGADVEDERKAEQMVERAERVEMPGSTSGSEREVARSLDPEAAT